MATKAQAESAMRKAGLDPAKHLDTDDYSPEYAVLDAPYGFHFKSEKTHSVAVGEDRKSDMYANIVRHCNAGLSACGPNKGCETCAEMGRFKTQLSPIQFKDSDGAQ